MASSKRSSRSSISDQNIPDNHQDSQTTEEISRYITRECTQYESRNTSTTDEVAEEVLEEELLEEEAAGQFAEAIYKGEGFRRTSNFLDSECGEPARAQHLRIDFSPVEGVDDNEYIVNKCRNFWTFVESSPDLKGLMALPDKVEVKVNSTKTVSVKCEPTAIDWMKHQELMSKAFTTKHKKRFCENGSGENCENWLTQKDKKKKVKAGSSSTVIRSVSRKRVLEPSRSENLHSSAEVTALCKQLEQWDLSHPKSMEPPGHPPMLSHALTQMDNL